MTLTFGTMLGPYEIHSAIGAGGMGEVYRATDTNLGRDVAIKVLPEAFAQDPERVARFEREAKTLASLNHPNIAIIHGLEKSQGTYALVMELVEGEDLSQRISRGPIPIDEALPIAKQIAEALEAAHEQGVIHRDLKPANIKVTPDGQVKVLDFGLAKLGESTAASTTNPAALSMSPTMTSPALMSGVGVILGTAAYMSPEQAKGRPADKRSDIWAFGCVLFEMLTGQRAFEGDDVADTLAAVLRGAPNWAALPGHVPVSIRALLEGCLKRDAKGRISDVSTLLFLLENQATLSSAGGIGARRPVGARFAVLSVLGVVLIGTLGIMAGRSMTTSVLARPTVTRFALTLPDDQQFNENGNHIVAVSPDGTHLVYVANRRLYLRSMAELDARPIAGTDISEGLISGPVFSPDGQSIAYWSAAGADSTSGVLKKIPVTGGAAATLCQIGFINGITWGADGILAGLRNNTVVRVPADGGQPESLVSVKDGRLWGPQMLPGGGAILFSLAKVSGSAVASLNDWDSARIVVHSMKGGNDKTVVEGAFGARYLSTGHLIYVSGGTLFAIRFDLGRLETVGRAVPLIEDVGRNGMLGGTPTGATYAGVSETGTLVYVSGSTSPNSDVGLIERTGQVTPLKLQSGSYRMVRVSPDGKHLALEKDENGEANIWIRDLTGAASMRQLTLGGQENRFPLWSPDGQRIAFQSNREGDGGIFWQRADGVGNAERLTKADDRTTHVPQSWSPDGGTLLFAVSRPEGTFTLNAVTLSDRKVSPFGNVRSTRYSPAAMFSPDGRWVAYTSSAGDAIGGAQVFVQPFPVTTTAYLISRGLHPFWSPDSRELFYHRLPDTSDHMEVVTVTTQAGQAAFTFANPVPLPIRQMRYSAPGSEKSWDMMPDGKRFIGIIDSPSAAGAAHGQINVVVNWSEELKQRVPTK